MRYFLLLTILLFSSSSLLSQEEWGSVDKNKLTVKEIAPIWPGCENESKKDDCFNQQLASHISKNFRYPAQAYKKNEQGKVIVEFIINKKGLVEIKKVSGGTKLLQEEAKRNILSFPKMAKPGILGGKPTSINYTVPITFKTGK